MQIDLLMTSGLPVSCYQTQNWKLKLTTRHLTAQLGAYQGDALSVVFTLYAAALNHLRAVSTYIRPNTPYSHHSLSLEWEYADDEEFVSENRETLDELYNQCEQTFKERNLKVNLTKTEFTKIYLADTSELDDTGEPIQHREAWRNKTLGSKLSTIFDVEHRCNRGQHAFQEYKKIWLKGTKISLQRKLLIYEAQVTSLQP